MGAFRGGGTRCPAHPFFAAPPPSALKGGQRWSSAPRCLRHVKPSCAKTSARTFPSTRGSGSANTYAGCIGTNVPPSGCVGRGVPTWIVHADKGDGRLTADE